jgi:hypothetical protein
MQKKKRGNPQNVQTAVVITLQITKNAKPLKLTVP